MFRPDPVSTLFQNMNPDPDPTKTPRSASLVYRMSNNPKRIGVKYSLIVLGRGYFEPCLCFALPISIFYKTY